jgi:sortase (surface protein transpeptidase)
MKGEYNDVFALINRLSPGDEIIVYYGQKKYTYIVQEQTVVKP